MNDSILHSERNGRVVGAKRDEVTRVESYTVRSCATCSYTQHYHGV